MEMEALTQRAQLLRESLQKSQAIADGVVAILGSFDHRLSALDAAMRPPRSVRTHAIRTAHENIDRTLRAADVILAQFDRIREAERDILKGPNEDLQGFLDAVDRLKSYYEDENEFQKQLTSRSKPLEPDRLFDCLPSSLRPSSEADSGGNRSSSNHSEQQQKLENAVYTPPTLIDPRFVPLLSKLAQQLVQAGHQQQCLRIYREARSSALEMSLKNLGVEN
uniref:Uncharacterized protein n=1 Tax=Ananas comosus var. bracteatus TaxID=296719 RepID=A0A6V7Q722_ANACO|nr:unnamed protein product [Ananas comosus var. bracteatus]